MWLSSTINQRCNFCWDYIHILFLVIVRRICAPARRGIAHVRRRARPPPCRRAVIKAIYENDNNGRYRADFRFAPSQWETSLQSNAVSHWLGTNLELALRHWLKNRKICHSSWWHWELPFWQLSVHQMMKISSKLWNFRFSGCILNGRTQSCIRWRRRAHIICQPRGISCTLHNNSSARYDIEIIS